MPRLRYATRHSQRFTPRFQTGVLLQSGAFCGGSVDFGIDISRIFRRKRAISKNKPFPFGNEIYPRVAGRDYFVLDREKSLLKIFFNRKEMN